MSKRELGFLSNELDLEGPRTKRRKEVAATPTTQPANPTKQSSNTTTDKPGNDAYDMDVVEGSGSGQDSVKEQGMQMWQTVKEAVNKEGYICSPPFLRLPSRRHYPDYYQVIPQPICLDDIKKKLHDGHYDSLEEVKQDFELCFSNAKEYNMKDSIIWRDAKFLHKQALKEYTRLIGRKESNMNGNDDGEERGNDDGKKKNKPPNMNRLLKSRLQKLVDKTDEHERVLSTLFMELPSKKDWPTYYKEIKRPQCLETIFKRLKRKEYHVTTDFAADVELVFSNALAFNQEQSPVWNDAITLRDYFRQLMSDLPPPFALAQYSKPSQTKIKLKVPVPMAPTGQTSSPAQPAQALPSGGLTLRVPASNAASKISEKTTNTIPPSPQTASSTPSIVTGAPPEPSPAPIFVAVPTSVSSSTRPSVLLSTPAPTPASPPNGSTPSEPAVAPAAAPTAPVPPPTLAPTSNVTSAQSLQSLSSAPPVVSSRPPTIPLVSPPLPPSQAAQAGNASSSTVPQTSYQATFSHYPNANYQPPIITPPAPPNVSPPAATIARSANAQTTQFEVSKTPPAITNPRSLRVVSVKTQPRGRPFSLDHRDGVKSWAMRLGQGESAVSVTNIKFMGGDEEESSDEDGAHDHHHEDEEEEEPVKKKRGRGRPPKNTKKEKSVQQTKVTRIKSHKTSTPIRENIQVVLNGTSVSEKVALSGEWHVELQVGSNVLEIGEKGGVTWKVFLERVSIT